LLFNDFPAERICWQHPASSSSYYGKIVRGSCYGATCSSARDKKPTFLPFTQRALSIETSFRVIGIQIFYSWQPASSLLRGTPRRVLPADGGSQGTTELPRREGVGELNAGRGLGKKRAGGGMGGAGSGHKDRRREKERGGGKGGKGGRGRGREGIIPRLNIGKNQYYLFSSTHRPHRSRLISARKEQENPGTINKSFLDDFPRIDRQQARRAGLLS
jgi:hypothetical protein